VVRNYTTADITNKTDRFIALSAVAKEYAVLLGDEYVAGLWRGNLLRQLCWLRKGPEVDQQLLTENNLPYQAPSWSWASLNSPTSNHLSSFVSVNEDVKSGTRDRCTEVLDICITPVGEDITGQVSRGIITIRGPVVHGTFSTPHSFRKIGSPIPFFSSLQSLETCYQVCAEIFWDRDPKYGTLITLLKLFHLADSYALILEAVDDQTYTRVGLLCYSCGPP
jgi:hypothetical protein